MDIMDEPMTLEREARWAAAMLVMCSCGHEQARHSCLPESMTGRPDLWGGCLRGYCPCHSFVKAAS